MDLQRDGWLKWCTEGWSERPQKKKHSQKVSEETKTVTSNMAYGRGSGSRFRNRYDVTSVLAKISRWKQKSLISGSIMRVESNGLGGGGLGGVGAATPASDSAQWGEGG